MDWPRVSFENESGAKLRDTRLSQHVVARNPQTKELKDEQGRFSKRQNSGRVGARQAKKRSRHADDAADY